ncbi:uncharacterized protein Z519_10501 [Cladophialophora bantiana CBS 173.52]|uniref:Protein SYS1 n=1 Tax=Cladophialophora bantiana (strain ATCC 10958 / CBS 173.52 / CDC B-1940 / NIH 8579) TaxID=1442370 RepID=A0A0D2EG71_CLAB1|nr:uncharacterized protein Z519_10501 [Cladophialophora bantiana CBS 173.52]KIW89016.1 hypothetical protein Z519_10501 [Cladophialophora bantiana CBS 173.52]
MPPRRRKPPRAGALTELPPLKIIRSILLLQLSYYATALVLILFTTLVLGQRFSLNLIFDWNSVRGDTTVGWTVGFLWVVDGFITVIPILLLISRSKLVPDFALTIHFIHLLITSFYTGGIPTNLLWWGLEAGSAALMITLGVWACRYREMQPISFRTPAHKKATGQNAANGSAEVAVIDDHIRSSLGRGIRNDAGPSYEMVNVRGDQNV